MPRLQLTHEMELMGKLRAGHARPLRSTQGSDLPLPGVFSGATGEHGAVKTAPYKPPAIAASQGGMTDCRKRCAHPLAPSARGLRPQAVGERTVRLPEIFRAMARFSPSAPSGHLPRRGRFFDTLDSPFWWAVFCFKQPAHKAHDTIVYFANAAGGLRGENDRSRSESPFCCTL